MAYKNLLSPRIVALGGGTGLSTMLRGLKQYNADLCAIVTMTDDGGGSGVLRDELGMPPPGDIRSCLEALANAEPTMQELLSYRFIEGRLKGQSFGNLFLAALNGMCSTFDEAVRRMSEVLAVTGRVLPVTNEICQLVAEFEDGAVISGETSIAEYKRGSASRISRVTLSPENPPALRESLRAIERADMIIIGPGSLYTSIIPNLITKDISSAVANSNALRVYVLNIMTQSGETESYSASDHIRALFEHSGERLFDFCLANSSPLSTEVIEKYLREDAEPTWVDKDELERMGISLVMAPVADDCGVQARHNPAALATELMRVFHRHAATKKYGDFTAL